MSSSPPNGMGVFFDNYRIPICRKCGGLGVEYNDPEFTRITRKIGEYCDQLFPTDGLPIEVPLIIKVEALKGIVLSVTELCKKFGHTEFVSYAEIIRKGLFDNRLQHAVAECEKYLASLEEQQNSSEKVDPVLLANLTAHKGNIEEAHNMFAGFVRKYPKDSKIASGFANFLLEFKRNIRAAVPFFVQATKGEPQNPEHFMMAIVLLVKVDRPYEAGQMALKSLGCPGIEEHLDVEEFIKNLPTSGVIN